MPELPEVETTCRGIKKPIINKIVKTVIIRQSKLRWQIPEVIVNKLPNAKIIDVKRRGKYLLIKSTTGTIIVHLGMSGCLRVLPTYMANDKHDHVDIIFTDGSCLRYTDPRRFGAILWSTTNPLQHPLLKSLGPEPLSRSFTGDYLFQQSRKRKIPVKTFIMQSRVVVGVGNIYANEALFLAKILPFHEAGKLSRVNYKKLSHTIKIVLKKAIAAGGTTLKDFYGSDGQPGYFKQALNVYGRANKPCLICHTAIEKAIIGQRASYYCPKCQK